MLYVFVLVLVVLWCVGGFFYGLSADGDRAEHPVRFWFDFVVAGPVFWAIALVSFFAHY